MTQEEIQIVTENVIRGVVPTFLKFIEEKLDKIVPTKLEEAIKNRPLNSAEVITTVANTTNKIINEMTNDNLSSYKYNTSEIKAHYIENLDPITASLLESAPTTTQVETYMTNDIDPLINMDYSKFNDLI